MVIWLNNFNAALIRMTLPKPPESRLNELTHTDNLKFLAYHQEAVKTADKAYKIVSYIDAMSADMQYNMNPVNNDAIVTIGTYLIQQSDAAGITFDLNSLISTTSSASLTRDAGVCNESKVVIADEVKKVAASAYAKHTDINEVKLGASVLAIGSEAFKDCSHLTAVTFNSDLMVIGSGAFMNCDLHTVVIPDEVEMIARDTFTNNKHLNSVHIGANVSEIGSSAFSSCYELLKVEIPVRTKTLRSGAFALCYGLINIDLGEVEYIDDFCFYRCRSLTDVVLPNTLKRLGRSAFNGCINLSTITVSDTIEHVGDDLLSDTNDDVVVKIRSTDTARTFKLQSALRQQGIRCEVI